MGLGIQVRSGFVSVRLLSPSVAPCLSTSFSVAAGFIVKTSKKKKKKVFVVATWFL